MRKVKHPLMTQRSVYVYVSREPQSKYYRHSMKICCINLEDANTSGKSPTKCPQIPISILQLELTALVNGILSRISSSAAL